MLLQNQPEIIVQHVLLRGAHAKLGKKVLQGSIKRDPLGFTIGEIEGYQCPRCKKSSVCLFQETGGWVCFCADKSCMLDDVSYQNKGQKHFHKPSKVSRDASTEFHFGSRYFNATLAKMVATPHQMEIISRWLNNPKNMLTIMGPPGTGKTYLCMAVANYLFEKNLHPVFFREQGFYEELQRGFSGDKNQYEIINRIAEYDFLILDDVGACGVTDWKEEVFFDLIDRRYNNQKPTLLTTNLDISSMQQTWGDRLARRIGSKENTMVVLTEFYSGPQE